jgi:peptidoglycan/xylan/chitin deacetylase (PgdA/CDA1 family)
MNSNWPLIIMYHSISHHPKDRNEMCTSPERFEAQMLWLKQHNRRGVSMRELYLAMRAGDNTRGLVGLTFDDGYEDFLHTAVPTLHTFGFSATVFAVAGMLGKENKWEHAYEPSHRMNLLTGQGLRAVAEMGMEVGSHGMTHTKLSGLESKVLNHEIGDSRRILSEVLGEPVEGFCYPYGGLDSAAIRAVQQAGYSYACGLRKEPVKFGVYNLPRMPMSEKDHFLRFMAKLKVYRHYSKILRNIGKRTAR